MMTELSFRVRPSFWARIRMLFLNEPLLVTVKAEEIEEISIRLEGDKVIPHFQATR